MSENAGTAIDYFEGEAEGQAPVEPMTLARLTKMAEEARDLETTINRLNVELAEAQDKRTNILRNLLPSAMDELGIKDFTLADDSKINVKDVINASISEENKPRAFAWLEENNCDGIIKTKVASEFGKGEIEDARKALKALEDAGFTGVMDRNVHPMTLKAFVKEQLEQGVALPLDVFGVFEFKEAKITKPKEKRARAR